MGGNRISPHPPLQNLDADKPLLRESVRRSLAWAYGVFDVGGLAGLAIAVSVSPRLFENFSP
jgi:hypothetical protein